MPSAPDLIPTTRLDKVDSTNLLARRHIDAGQLTAAHFYIAKEQTGGIGRHARQWHSPLGGLWCTLAWPVSANASPAPAQIASALGLRVGVVCLHVIADTLSRRMSRHMPQLKWPNDVLINRRKVCGSLCEALAVEPTSPGKARTTWFLVGVGINVNNDVSELPQDLRRPAIALCDVVEGPEPVDLDDLARRLLAGLVHAMTTPGLDEHTLRAARERLYGTGSPISIVPQDGIPTRGVLVGLSDRGLPLLRTGEIEFEVPPGTELA
ncbi:MAG: biotin--[acetyl-CoA-carboxylase] ligase [Phycisphaerales bacterium]